MNFLRIEDVENNEYPARLTDKLSNADLIDSQKRFISVQYNEIDLGKTKYGFLKRIFDSIDPEIAKANPLIFHFALNPDNDNTANRRDNIRNPRVYFMVGKEGMIHVLFFDPYHEINP